jgi:hypothetical protein
MVLPESIGCVNEGQRKVLLCCGALALLWL